MNSSTDVRSSLKLSPPVIVILVIVVAVSLWQRDEKGDVPEFGDTPFLQTEGSKESKGVAESDGDTSSSVPESSSFLKEIGNKTFESPAGLIYSTGSADGHRLDHLMKHSVDVPSKPVHGVFNGDKNEILSLLDEVWTMSQERGPPNVETKQERGRTVITANLKRVIGYVGGESGKRKDYPKCSKVRLVIEGQNVITAYPVL